MLHFETLKWKNLLSTGNAYTEIRLDRSPTTAIVGENGAGKSTILDALCYVLFNKPFRNINKPNLINSINERGMVVEIEFHIGKQQYKVVRGMKPNVFEIYVNGNLIDQPGAIKDYQKILEDTILRLNYKSFTQIVILGNASFTPFMQLSSRDRREVIEDLLDIQIFSNMNLLLKDRLSENKSEQAEIGSQIEIIENKIEVQNNYLNQLQRDIDSEINEYLELIANKKQLTTEYNAKNVELSSEVSRYMESIKDSLKVDSKMSKVSDILSKLHDKGLKADKRLSFFERNDHCPTCEQEIDVKIKQDKITKTKEIIDKTTDAVDRLQTEQRELANRLTQIEIVQSKINAIQQQVTSNQNEINSIASTVVEFEKKVASLEDKKTTDTHSTVEIESLQKDLATYNKKKETLSYNKELYDFASHLLKDGGIKTKIIRQYVPIINKLVNKYLAAMDFFVNFELNEEFSEVIRSRHRDDFSYASFSEGEKSRIDISLMLTWRAVAKLKNSVNTNLLILDEVFDSSMDTNGVEILMGLFNELHDTNIFVISHKGDLLVDKFRSMIKFEKIRSFSRIA